MAIRADVAELLEIKASQYETEQFIAQDPIQIPHLFTQKSDIEISGFLAATIAWGQRSTIIANAKRLVELMDMAPGEFIIGFTEADLSPFRDFKHRTFQFDDLVYFLKSLQRVYTEYGGLEQAFKGETAFEQICHFNQLFTSFDMPTRTGKHVANPAKGSSAKRLNMFLRWMVRSPQRGVDFGLWKSIQPAQLCLPLDVHTGNSARALGLLDRKQNDWKALGQIMQHLRQLDPVDPVKYDFALFGLSKHESF